MQQITSAEQVALFNRQRAFVDTVPQRFHMIKAAARFWLQINIWRHSTIAVAPQDWTYNATATPQILSHFGPPIITLQIYPRLHKIIMPKKHQYSTLGCIFLSSVKKVSQTRWIYIYAHACFICKTTLYTVMLHFLLCWYF